jgi:hypothetical protein
VFAEVGDKKPAPIACRDSCGAVPDNKVDKTRNVEERHQERDDVG